MSLISWNNNLSVGVEVLDQQHQRWIELINETHEAMLGGRTQEEMSQTLNALIEYTQTHLSYEENLLAQYNYPDLTPHHEAHTAMTARIQEYKQRYDAGEAIIGIEILKLLKDWLIGHIVGVDKKYGPYLNERGIH